MKKAIYSVWLKAFFAVLFVAGMVLGVLTVTKGIVDFSNEEEQVYSFENDFSEAGAVSHLVNEPENLVYMVYHELYYDGYDSYGSPVYKNTYTAPNSGTVANAIQTRLNNFYYNEEVNYYIQWNDLKFTNCDVLTPEALMDGECFSYVKRDSAGNIERASSGDTLTYLMEDISRFDSVSTIIIGCSVKEEVLREYQQLWEKQEKMIFDIFLQALLCAGTALLALVYLICVCGKNKDGEYRRLWIDRIWLEVHLAAIGGFGFGATAVCWLVLEEYMYWQFPLRMLYPIVGAATGLGSLAILTSLLSVIRNLKTRNLLETSIIFQVLRWLVRLILRAAKWLWRKTKAFWRVVFKMLWKKSGVMIGVLLLVYTVAIGFCGVLLPDSPVFLFIAMIFAVFSAHNQCSLYFLEQCCSS